MPELPEVETIVRDLQAAGLEGRRILRTQVLWPRSVADLTPRSFATRLRGLRVDAVQRRGKYIILLMSNGWSLLIHLRMSGRLMLDSQALDDPHARVLFHLSDGRVLRFHDPRKFGRVAWAEDVGSRLAHLGPEPLAASCTSASLFASMQKTSRSVKAVLLDQAVLAGVGNIYADEALFDAGIHPARPARDLTREESTRLLRSVKKVLRKGVKNLGTSLGHGRSNFQRPQGEEGRNREGLCAYGREGLPCIRCGSPIQKTVLAQRGTHFCPVCQSV